MVPRLRVASFVYVIAALVAACALFLHDSPYGQGIAFDSTHYMSAATNLREGQGLDVSFTSGFDPLPTSTALEEYGHVPLTHFPPGYPVALAVADTLLPGGLQGAARAIGFIAVVLGVLSAWVILRVMRADPAIAALGALCIGLTPSFQRFSMWVLSDAIAAALAVSALAVACLRSSRVPTTTIQLAAGFVAAASVLVRYGGVGGAVGAFVLCVDWRAVPRARLAVAARTLLPSVGAVVTMFAVNALRGAGEARPVAWHPPVFEDVRVFLATAGMWTIGQRPNSRLFVAAALLFAALAFAAWLLSRRTAESHADAADRPPSPARAGVALGAFALTQVLVLLGTSTLLDNDVSFDRRLMLPAELVVGILLVGAFAVRPPAVLGALMIAAFAIGRMQMPIGPFPQGTARPEAPTYDTIFDALATYPDDIILATNVPEVVWASSGRASIFAPAEYDTLSGRRTSDIDARIRELGRLVGERGGLLLLQRVESPRLTRPSDVARVLTCAQLVHENETALIYDLAPCAP